MQVTFIFAFVAVLALMLLAAWLIRRFANSRLGTNTNRGRMPRLAVIDAAAVDGRRRLVLVRRDNIEHLLMIGGPTDIVVEANIVRAQARSEQFPQRPPAAEPPPRPSRPPFADEVRRQAPVPPERRGERTTDPLTGFAPEPLAPRPEPRPEPITPRLPRTEPMIARASRQAEPKAPPVVRAAPPPPPPPPPPPAPAQNADQNLAEMAQRLEAALRRPAGSADAPPVAPEPPAPPPSRATRSEPAVPPPPPAPSPKSSFENLEEEMSSLLGRPKSSSS